MDKINPFDKVLVRKITVVKSLKMVNCEANIMCIMGFMAEESIF